MAGFHSRDQVITLEGAFDKDARLTALSADIVANVGAYSCFPTTCGVEPLMAMAELPGPYQAQAYDCVSRGVVTHTCPMAPYRGVSRPVITFALERLMDKAAARFGIDPIEIRRRNLIDRFPYKSATGLTFDEASYRQTLEMAIEHIDLPAFRARQKQARARRPLSRHRLLDVFRTNRLRQSGVCGARHGDHARLGKRRDHHGPLGPGGGADRVVAARAGVANDARPDHRRRDRHRACADQGHPWRYRPRALWLGHLCQPLAGDRRRREPDRGAEAADQAAQDRKPYAGGLGRRYRARSRHGQGQRHRPFGADRDHGAPGLLSNPSLQGRDRARPDRNRRLRSGRHLLQCVSRCDRRWSISTPGMWRSRNSWWRKMPAASSIR